MAAKKKLVYKKKLQKETHHDSPVHDIYDNAINSKVLQRLSTGLVYDYSMADHKCLWDENYPECPERFLKVMERCNELHLVDKCKRIESRIADEDELLIKHNKEQIEFLKTTENITNVNMLEKLSSKYDAIYFHPSTYRLSLKAVGSTINLVTSICKGEVQNGMAIIRPPGHHAMKAEYCGYCFFNNVAIACEKTLQMDLAKKILIVDWDVHHGQATQQMFYDDPRVVYFSIHRYENGEFWPNLRESNYDYTGSGPGEGHNFNVPLNKVGMTNADYIAIFQQLLLPMAYEFQPDLVIVSAGYDAALGCPEGEMKITPACYSHLLWSLMSLAKGKVAVVLEGGYCLESLSEGAALTLRALLGDPCPQLLPIAEPCDSVRETILNVIYTHKPFWKCYQYQGSYSFYSNEINENCEERHIPICTFSNSNATVSSTYETRNCYPVQSTEKKAEIQAALSFLKQCTNLNKAQFKLCVVYDCRMLKHFDSSDDFHPEKPSRIASIYAKFQEYGILKRCLILQGKMATEDELLLVHSKKYIDVIKQTSVAETTSIDEKISAFNSVYINPDTWISARIATGSLLQVVDSVLSNKCQSGTAIIRPPGHHAEKDTACGFCIFNNVAIAAKYAIHNYKVQRILIIDWDVHHGNGTQAVFKDDPNVLYISIHRYDNGSFFPNSEKGNSDFVGEGKGEGFNVNIPWNEKGMGDSEYIAAFQQIVMPIAYQYNPDLILVSAGFDACVGDPIGNCHVSPELYGHLTHWLSALANGRIILILEGGYNVNSISYAMTLCNKALLGDPLMSLASHQLLRPSALTSIKDVLKIQKKYWPNLKYQVSLPQEDILADAVLQEKLISKNENDQVVSSTILLEKEFEKVSLENSNLKATIPEGESNIYDEVENAEGNSACQIVIQQSIPQSLLIENMQSLFEGDMFAIVPKTNCMHVSEINKLPETDIDIYKPCTECSSVSENWICLKCHTVLCARNIKKHALIHAQETQHPIALSFSDLSVWCYLCESYIDSPVLYDVKNFVHISKFNEELPRIC